MSDESKRDRYSVGEATQAESADQDDTADGSSQRPAARPDTANTSRREGIGFSTEPGDDYPHRIKYDSPSAERQQIEMKVGDEERRHLARLEQLADETFAERVYATDVRLAALVAGLRSDDETFLAEMRRIGYGQR